MKTSTNLQLSRNGCDSKKMRELYDTSLNNFLLILMSQKVDCELVGLLVEMKQLKAGRDFDMKFL